MATIDGLITGIDTTSVIEGLLEIRQAQITRLEARKAEIVTRKSSFSGIEASLLSLRSQLGRLSGTRNNALQEKTVTSSNEDVLVAAASSSALVGVYQLSVEQLATAHTIGSNGFESPDAQITTGELQLQVGSGVAQTITINNQNNTLQGLAEAINSSGAGVNATIINIGDTTDDQGNPVAPYRLVLSSQQSGSEHQIAITNNLAASAGDAVQPVFDFDNPIDAGNNARVTFGTGPGQISVESSTNQIDELIAGVTIDLRGADPGQLVTLTVDRDVEAATTGVQDFVKGYNDLMKFIAAQTQYIPESEDAGPLLGDRTVISIQDELQIAISSVVQGVSQDANRLSAIGISVNNDGTLLFNPTDLDDIYSGRTEGVSPEDVVRLFALTGKSSSSGVSFVAGSTRTEAADVEVEITAAAERAAINGTVLGASITIDATNDAFSLSLDGRQSSDLTLAHGTYTPMELAALLESTINGDEELIGREVSVSVQDGGLRVRSASYGSSSEIKALNGSALTALGFTGTESDKGLNVVGHFLVNGVREDAVGSGQVLAGDPKNTHTADLRVRVALNNNQLIPDGPEATVSVARGLASQLDRIIGDMVKVGDSTGKDAGEIRTANSRFDQLIEDVDESIRKMNERFDAEEESLLRQFAALESAVAGFQNTASFLSAQLLNTGGGLSIG